MTLPTAIGDAFRRQAEFCRGLAAPTTAAVCDAVPLACDAGTRTGARLGAWPGEPMTDALPMRLTGALNALVRSNRAPELAPLYPPAPAPAPEAMAAALRALLADPARDAEIATWLDSPPQTNEVARSGALMPGLMTVAAATGLPLRLFELGASAGLNLNMDRFAHDLGGVAAGDPGSPVHIGPHWQGPPPPAAQVRVIARQGADTAPLNAGDDAVAGRLLAFVWPDQPERVARAETAITLARHFPPPLVRADAADWVEAEVAPVPGSVAVVYHSIAFQYFPPARQQRIAAHLARQGASATSDAALAWLRMEMDDPARPALPSLRLTLWRGAGAEERLLGHAHPHGAFVQWA